MNPGNQTERIHHFRPQIRFCDGDPLGHINNAVYLSYFEMCRIDWLDQYFRGAFSQRGERIPIILARSEVDYLQEGFLHDQMTIASWIDHIGTTSFHQAYELQCSQRGLIARGRAVLVWFDFDERCKKPLPEEMKLYLTQYLKKPAGKE